MNKHLIPRHLSRLHPLTLAIAAALSLAAAATAFAGPTIDPAFVPIVPAAGHVSSAYLTPGGDEVYVVGYTNSPDGSQRAFLARLHADGSADPAFAPTLAAGTTPSQVVVQPDGKVVCNLLHGTDGTLVRFNADGTLDAAFNVAGPANSNHLFLQPDGKILAAGFFTNLGGGVNTNVARLNADGSPDASFACPVGAELSPYGATVQPDGKLLIAGNPPRPLTRLNTDGSVDAGFVAAIPADGYFGEAVAVQPGGKVLYGGDFTGGLGGKNLVRLNADGSADPSFVSPSVAGDVVSLFVQADGKILGSFGKVVNGAAGSDLPRLNADGTIDTSFQVTVDADLNFPTFAQQADGKLLVADNVFTTFNGAARPGLVRLLADGDTVGMTASVISVTAQKAQVPADGSGGPATVVFTRTGDLTQALKISYSVKGSAIAGKDYVALSGRKKMKAGEATAVLKVIPQGPGKSGKKTIKLTILPGDGYALGAEATVKLKLLGK